jgi:hypothetical protein
MHKTTGQCIESDALQATIIDGTSTSAWTSEKAEVWWNDHLPTKGFTVDDD